ncbi:DUF1499 domain-containing protein [Devosia rhodophyticola]|uniref:DUF1499 domain-containing protein n=1 Tax=Devosia rhodophyticola TaxID=3026423 RepID=A0ABY7YYV2_9HYPH|nr:DUF1499 domain-containing protein [Devosia rhodophyticola]WDR06506.1 DUF1499 domain-containing protein [Devosia rhodophyticola]
MRILIRTSKWAIWSRRIASIAVPMVVIPLVLHHLQLLASDSFLNLAMITLAVTVMGLISALIALVRLWIIGDQGWGRAISALLLCILCLIPFGYAAALLLRYPETTDVATTQRQLLPLVFDPTTRQMSPPRLLDDARQEKAFPNAKTRNYPLNAAQTFALVARMIDDQGWEIRGRHDPTGSDDPGTINARMTTLLGFRDEAVVRVSGDATRSSVDMRSASLNATHDLGANGLRIEKFLGTLDNQVTDLLRDNPNINQPLDADDDPPEPQP